MPDAKGLLAVWMEPPAAMEGDLNRWYESEHLTERMGVPGFVSARRYVSEKGEPKYVALYRLTDVEILAGVAYQAVAQNPTPETQRVQGAINVFIRNEYALAGSEGDFDAPPAPYVYLVRAGCDEAHREEMQRWYLEDHLPRTASVEGVFSTSVYIATVGSPAFLAVYEVGSPAIPRSPAWDQAAASPWLDKVRPFFRDTASNLGRLIATRP